ncbi:glycosyltransferase family 4 protein [Modestobacter sp. NPDC049651]|uniref:glycosyltransferase family 4 protein n=1 Tax=unclassified Modestobacter TaxID=2643866 RepID=UPI0033E11C6C
MRIGLIAPPWLPVPPPAYGGTESVIDRLARGLVRDGHEVLLAAAANSTCPVGRVPGTDEAVAGAPATGGAVDEVRHVVTSYGAMGDVDVVHDHTTCGPVYRHQPVGVPVVTTNHGPFNAPLNAIYRSLRDVPVIAISHAQAASADGVRIAAVIHHGIDVVAVPEGRGRGGFASFLGRMSPEKGPREAVLVARAAGVPLRLAAKLREPAERQYFEAEVEPLLGGGIEYVGELGEKDKLDLVGDSFALLNPIQWPEPFGLVMIEALATGTPVVTTPSGAAPEIVDDGVTGYLRGDRHALIESLLAAADLDRTACRASAVARFDTDRMVREHVELYTGLLDSERRLPRPRVTGHPVSRRVLQPRGLAPQLDA